MNHEVWNVVATFLGLVMCILGAVLALDGDRRKGAVVVACGGSLVYVGVRLAL